MDGLYPSSFGCNKLSLGVLNGTKKLGAVRQCTAAHNSNIENKDLFIDVEKSITVCCCVLRMKMKINAFVCIDLVTYVLNAHCDLWQILKFIFFGKFKDYLIIFLTNNIRLKSTQETKINWYACQRKDPILGFHRS